MSRNQWGESKNQEMEAIAKESETEDDGQMDTEQEEILEQNRQEAQRKDVDVNGRHRFDMDVDRMVNEGLGGGQVGKRSGLIDESHVEGDSSLE
ncbi:hypothetical protein [Desmospora activa]|uniref:Uncharacterized protein n=1 Tax=Desmospora activa DSM 45169 TaxID=1121389 RepID=A0A2T4Z775_9BACL|nr:hypothetical protein [Desmospora activa]PTM57731.1 hypothetical protein C8J48_0283 [Desmospora activa DSM 45169]